VVELDPRIDVRLNEWLPPTCTEVPRMDIGILGAGAIGRALAVQAVRAGLRPIIGNSRGPGSLVDVVRALGPGVKAGTRDEVVEPEIVILAVPWRSIPNALANLPEWNGRILVDATNPTEPLDLGFPGVLSGTSSEIVAQLSPTGRVVKAFNTLKPDILAADPQEYNGRRVIFYSGNHDPSKAEIARLINRFGFCGIDLGSLADGGRLQQYPGGPLLFLNLLRLG
jgi:predicted dinucleotide-binding enzyme